MSLPEPRDEQSRVLPCHECDMVSAHDFHTTGWIECPRCQHPITHHTPKDTLTPALAMSALVMLTLSLCFPYLGFEKSGIERIMTINDASIELATFDQPILALITLLTIVILPGCYLLAILFLHYALTMKRHASISKRLIQILPTIQPWMMADVFVIAALVSLVKLVGMVEVKLFPSFWTFAAFAFLLLATTLRVNSIQLWERQLGTLQQPRDARPGHTSRSQNLSACHHCGQLQNCHNTHCIRCHHSLHERAPLSLQRVIALLLTATLFSIPAQSLPIMVTKALGKEDPATIIAGAMLFLKHGDWPIALIIFTASVLIPFGKIMAIAWLCLATRRTSPMNMKTQMRLYRVTEWIGRWSMVDVFVIAIVVAMLQIGQILSVAPGLGGIAFCGMVIFTMLASHQFDPRLIWDNQGDNLKTQESDVG